MYYSKYNIFSRIKNSSSYFLVNLLTGNADILNQEDAGKLTTVKNTRSFTDKEFINELAEKGYITDDQEEAILYRNKYLDFIDSRDKEEIQLFFVPNYSCNFACSYCYQDEYSNLKSSVSNELIDTFFKYIQHKFAGRRKYITIFGGEPLIPSSKQKQVIKYLVQKANEANMDMSFVTNGFTLEEYVPILKEAHIREIQVTLDGTASIHNSRRFLKDGSGTFNKIVNGIDTCLENNLTVNLRMVIDKENIDNLPEFASFAIDKGWTKSSLFKTQIGRNYELHHCQSAPNKLFSRISLYETLFGLIQKFPHISEFYKPAYSISRFLAENDKTPEPLFDACPACKTEWAFDYTGHIYPCTATVGKTNESVGTFYPEVNLNQNMINEWEMRDVTAISECKECNLQLACGGGCGSIAKNNSGNLLSPDCRPVNKLMELGFASYFETTSNLTS